MVMKIKHVADYRKLRGSAYPQIGDQLDELWKLLESVPALNAALAASPVFQSVAAVKARYPKPEAGVVVAHLTRKQEG